MTTDTDSISSAPTDWEHTERALPITEERQQTRSSGMEEDVRKRGVALNVSCGLASWVYVRCFAITAYRTHKTNEESMQSCGVG